MQNLRQGFEEDAAALAEFLICPGPLRPSHVRVSASAVVRRWLLDGQLNRLSQELDGALTLPTVDTSSAVAEIAANPSVQFFMAGGVILDGEVLRGLYVSDAPYEGCPPISGAGLGTSLLQPSRYLRSRRVFHKGQWFTAEQVIRFVANKHGGVHFDMTREYEWQCSLENAARFFVVGNPERLKERQIIEGRSPEHTILLVLPREVGFVWSCLEIELLSAAQSLVNVNLDGEPLLEWRPSHGDST